MRSQRISAGLIALSICMFGGVGTGRAAILSDLINGGQSIQVGNLLFDSFSYLQTGDMPQATGINVNPYVSGGGDMGLTFQGAFQDFLGGAGSDALIGYHVTVLAANIGIVGSTLSGVPTVLGGSGIVSVTESFQPTNFNDLFSIYSLSPGSSQTTNSVAFAGNYSSLVVQESVLAFSAGGAAGVSFFNATFATAPISIPEPASATLLGLGIATLAWRRWRKR